MNKDNVAEWREEFDKILTRIAQECFHDKYLSYNSENMVIDFISNLLTSHRLSLKEELLGKLPRESENYRVVTYDTAFNSCLSQVKEVLTSVFKEK